MEYSPPVSLVHGILQARIPEWVAIPFSRGSSQPRDWTHVSLCLLHWQVGSLPLAPPESPTAWLEGWNSQPSPQPPGRRQALKVESIPSGQWLNQACLCYEASIKILDTDAQVSYLVSNILFVYYHALYPGRDNGSGLYREKITRTFTMGLLGPTLCVSSFVWF